MQIKHFAIALIAAHPHALSKRPYAFIFAVFVLFFTSLAIMLFNNRRVIARAFIARPKRLSRGQGIAGLMLAFSGLLVGFWLMQQQNFPGSSSSSSAGFSATAFGAVYDDSTDNCTAFTALTAASNAYSGPGIPGVSLAPPAGSSGKAYKTSCNLIFTVPTDIDGGLGGTDLDCQQSAAFANCVQLGPSNLANFTNAQTPPYKLHDITFVSGSCVNVTVACIQAEPWVSNPQILRVYSGNVGAGNASPPACTNWFISFDGHNNAPQILDTVYWSTDGTTGRCWSTNNRTAAVGGTNSGLIEHNTIIGAGAAPGFTAPCGSIGHTELGSATIIKGNQFYGFGQPLLLLNPQFGTMIDSNQFDQAGCTAGGVASADIHYGNGSNGAVNLITVKGNYFPQGAGHALSAIAVSSGSSSALSNFIFTGNVASGSGAKNIFPSGTVAACGGECWQGSNTGFLQPSGNSATWRYSVGSRGTAQVAQAANIGTTAFTTTENNSELQLVSCSVVLTQAATTSSTLPSCSVIYTDTIANVSVTLIVNACATTTNVVGNTCQGSVVIPTRGGTTVSYSTGSYASVGGTPMQYAVWIRVLSLN